MDVPPMLPYVAPAGGYGWREAGGARTAYGCGGREATRVTHTTGFDGLTGRYTSLFCG
jgi:hypothetical protein